MALTNLRVRLARATTDGWQLRRNETVGSCVATRSMVGSCVLQKHAQSILQLLNLLYAGCTWKSGRLTQSVDVSVPQSEEERVKANQLVHPERVEADRFVPQECTQQHINEPNLIVWNGIRNLHSVKMLQA